MPVDHLDALRSDLSEAERHLRETPTCQIEKSYLMRLLQHAMLMLREARKAERKRLATR